MDFHSMKRKELQGLCKKHKIPANLTNLEMAQKLSSLFKIQEKEQPKRRARSCLKNSVEIGDNLIDVSNRMLKKVRFSPENDVFEFEDMKFGVNVNKKNRRMGDHVVGDEDSPGRVTRASKRASLGGHKVLITSPVVVKKWEKRAVKEVEESDKGLLLVDSNDYAADVRTEVITEKILRNRKVDNVVVSRKNVRKRSTQTTSESNSVKVSENEVAMADGRITQPQIELRRSTRNVIKCEESEGLNEVLGNSETFGMKKIRSRIQMAVNASAVDSGSRSEPEHRDEVAHVISRKSLRQQGAKSTREKSSDKVAKNIARVADGTIMQPEKVLRRSRHKIVEAEGSDGLNAESPNIDLVGKRNIRSVKGPMVGDETKIETEVKNQNAHMFSRKSLRQTSQLRTIAKSSDEVIENEALGVGGGIAQPEKALRRSKHNEMEVVKLDTLQEEMGRRKKITRSKPQFQVKASTGESGTKGVPREAFEVMIRVVEPLRRSGQHVNRQHTDIGDKVDGGTEVAVQSDEPLVRQTRFVDRRKSVMPQIKKVRNEEPVAGNLGPNNIICEKDSSNKAREVFMLEKSSDTEGHVRRSRRNASGDDSLAILDGANGSGSAVGKRKTRKRGRESFQEEVPFQYTGVNVNTWCTDLRDMVQRETEVAAQCDEPAQRQTRSGNRVKSVMPEIKKVRTDEPEERVNEGSTDKLDLVQKDSKTEGHVKRSRRNASGSNSLATSDGTNSGSAVGKSKPRKRGQELIQEEEICVSEHAPVVQEPSRQFILSVSKRETYTPTYITGELHGMKPESSSKSPNSEVEAPLPKSSSTLRGSANADVQYSLPEVPGCTIDPAISAGNIVEDKIVSVTQWDSSNEAKAETPNLAEAKDLKLMNAAETSASCSVKLQTDQELEIEIPACKHAPVVRESSRQLTCSAKKGNTDMSAYITGKFSQTKPQRISKLSLLEVETSLPEVISTIEGPTNADVQFSLPEAAGCSVDTVSRTTDIFKDRTVCATLQDSSTEANVLNPFLEGSKVLQMNMVEASPSESLKLQTDHNELELVISASEHAPVERPANVDTPVEVVGSTMDPISSTSDVCNVDPACPTQQDTTIDTDVDLLKPAESLDVAGCVGSIDTTSLANDLSLVDQIDATRMVEKPQVSKGVQLSSTVADRDVAASIHEEQPTHQLYLPEVAVSTIVSSTRNISKDSTACKTQQNYSTEASAENSNLVHPNPVENLDVAGDSGPIDITSVADGFSMEQINSMGMDEKPRTSKHANPSSIVVDHGVVEEGIINEEQTIHQLSSPEVAGSQRCSNVGAQHPSPEVPGYAIEPASSSSDAVGDKIACATQQDISNEVNAETPNLSEAKDQYEVFASEHSPVVRESFRRFTRSAIKGKTDRPAYVTGRNSQKKLQSHLKLPLSEVETSVPEVTSNVEGPANIDVQFFLPEVDRCTVEPVSFTSDMFKDKTACATPQDSSTQNNEGTPFTQEFERPRLMSTVEVSPSESLKLQTGHIQLGLDISASQHASLETPASVNVQLSLPEVAGSTSNPISTASNTALATQHDSSKDANAETCNLFKLKRENMDVAGDAIPIDTSSVAHGFTCVDQIDLMGKTGMEKKLQRSQHVEPYSTVVDDGVVATAAEDQPIYQLSLSEVSGSTPDPVSSTSDICEDNTVCATQEDSSIEAKPVENVDAAGDAVPIDITSVADGLTLVDQITLMGMEEKPQTIRDVPASSTVVNHGVVVEGATIQQEQPIDHLFVPEVSGSTVNPVPSTIDTGRNNTACATQQYNSIQAYARTPNLVDQKPAQNLDVVGDAGSNEIASVADGFSLVDQIFSVVMEEKPQTSIDVQPSSMMVDHGVVVEGATIHVEQSTAETGELDDFHGAVRKNSEIWNVSAGHIQSGGLEVVDHGVVEGAIIHEQEITADTGEPDGFHGPIRQHSNILYNSAGSIQSGDLEKNKGNDSKEVGDASVSSSLMEEKNDALGIESSGEAAEPYKSDSKSGMQENEFPVSKNIMVVEELSILDTLLSESEVCDLSGVLRISEEHLKDNHQKRLDSTPKSCSKKQHSCTRIYLELSNSKEVVDSVAEGNKVLEPEELTSLLSGTKGGDSVAEGTDELEPEESPSPGANILADGASEDAKSCFHKENSIELTDVYEGGLSKDGEDGTEIRKDASMLHSSNSKRSETEMPLEVNFDGGDFDQAADIQNPVSVSHIVDYNLGGGKSNDLSTSNISLKEVTSVEKTIEDDPEGILCTDGNTSNNLDSQLPAEGERGMEITCSISGDVRKRRTHESSTGEASRPVITDHDIDRTEILCSPIAASGFSATVEDVALCCQTPSKGSDGIEHGMAISVGKTSRKLGEEIIGERPTGPFVETVPQINMNFSETESHLDDLGDDASGLHVLRNEDTLQDDAPVKLVLGSETQTSTEETSEVHGTSDYLNDSFGHADTELNADLYLFSSKINVFQRADEVEGEISDAWYQKTNIIMDMSEDAGEEQETLTRSLAEEKQCKPGVDHSVEKDARLIKIQLAAFDDLSCEDDEISEKINVANLSYAHLRSESDDDVHHKVLYYGNKQNEELTNTDLEFNIMDADKPFVGDKCDMEASELRDASASETKPGMAGQLRADADVASDGTVAALDDWKGQLELDIAECKDSDFIAEGKTFDKHNLHTNLTQGTPAKSLIMVDMKENSQSFKKQPGGLIAASVTKRRALGELQKK